MDIIYTQTTTCLQQINKWVTINKNENPWRRISFKLSSLSNFIKTAVVLHYFNLKEALSQFQSEIMQLNTAEANDKNKKIFYRKVD